MIELFHVIALKSVRSHIASLQASNATTYSASQDEAATVFCLRTCQEITPKPSVYLGVSSDAYVSSTTALNSARSTGVIQSHIRCIAERPDQRYNTDATTLSFELFPSNSLRLVLWRRFRGM